MNQESAPGPWTAWPVGVRVVVRRRLAEGGFSDVLGDLLATGPEGVRVRTRRGEVAVPAADIVLGKTVPPPPAPRTRRRA
ncbi:MAG: ferrous iron transport protein A [Actinotalea sp.]|nr:ferrous iron transport protein A [Actinotalea sp.]